MQKDFKQYFEGIPSESLNLEPFSLTCWCQWDLKITHELAYLISVIWKVQSPLADCTLSGTLLIVLFFCDSHWGNLHLSNRNSNVLILSWLKKKKTSIITVRRELRSLYGLTSHSVLVNYLLSSQNQFCSAPTWAHLINLKRLPVLLLHIKHGYLISLCWIFNVLLCNAVFNDTK